MISIGNSADNDFPISNCLTILHYFQVTSRQRLADKSRILTELESKVRELQAALEAAEGKSSRSKIREKARKEDEDTASTEIRVSSDRVREKRHAPPKVVKEERDDEEAERQIEEKETKLSRVCDSFSASCYSSNEFCIIIGWTFKMQNFIQDFKIKFNFINDMGVSFKVYWSKPGNYSIYNIFN